MENSLTYTPVDTNSIKPAKLTNELALENEINKICDVLKDTCKYIEAYSIRKQ